MPQVSGDGVQVKPIYTSANAASVNAGTANWIQAGLPGSIYGPVNARALSLKADDETTQRAAMSGQVAALTHRVDEMAATIGQQAAAIKRLLLVQQAAPAPRPSRVSVLEFGADPTGQADSTAAIQAALNRSGGQGGIVDVPSGFFRCHSGLVVPAGVTLLRRARATRARPCSYPTTAASLRTLCCSCTRTRPRTRRASSCCSTRSARAPTTVMVATTVTGTVRSDTVPQSVHAVQFL